MQQNDPTEGEALVYETALEGVAHLAERKHVSPALRDRTLALLRTRVEAGKAKYGTYLMTFNGRNALQDAWEEAADLMFYLEQAAMEDPRLGLSLESSRDAARSLVLFLAPAAPDGA